MIKEDQKLKSILKCNIETFQFLVHAVHRLEWNTKKFEWKIDSRITRKTESINFKCQKSANQQADITKDCLDIELI